MSLVFPMFTMVLLTFGVALVMLRSRMSAVKKGEIDPRYFKTYQGSAPDSVVKAQRHFSNLFELPVLFYVGCLAAMILHMDGVLITAWAWFFVVSRIIHAFIHIGSNKLSLRMPAYVLGWIAVLAIWISLVIALSAR